MCECVIIDETVTVNSNVTIDSTVKCLYIINSDFQIVQKVHNHEFHEKVKFNLLLLFCCSRDNCFTDNSLFNNFDLSDLLKFQM